MWHSASVPTPGRRATLTSDEVVRVRREIERWQKLRNLTAADILWPTTWGRIQRGDPIKAATLLRADDALNLERGSLERVARAEGKAVPLDDPDQVMVVKLPNGQPAASVGELWLVSGRMAAVAEDLPPNIRGRLKVLVEELIQDYEDRRSR